MSKDDEHFMHLALSEAEKARRIGEVPVGAVLVDKKQSVISKGFNLRESKNDPTAHAEIIVLKKASKKLKSWRLTGNTLYVTLEPCVMCIGAMLSARIDRLVYGAKDSKAGAVDSVYTIGVDNKLNHKIEILAEVLGVESRRILSEFFKEIRILN